jgi:glycerate dehydrogenase
VKDRVVFIDRAGFGDTADLPIPDFDHTWSEFPHTSAAELIPRVFWATTLVTHACDLTEDVLTQLHKLQRVVVTGSAVVDEAVCAARGVRVTHLPPGGSGAALIAHLEADPVR